MCIRDRGNTTTVLCWLGPQGARQHPPIGRGIYTSSYLHSTLSIVICILPWFETPGVVVLTPFSTSVQKIGKTPASHRDGSLEVVIIVSGGVLVVVVVVL